MKIPKHGSFSHRLYKLFVLNPNVAIDTKPIQREVGQIRFFRRLYAARDRYNWDIQKVTPGSVDGMFVFRPDGESPTKHAIKVQLPNPANLTVKSADYWWDVAKEKLDRGWDGLRDRLGDQLPVGAYCLIEIRLPIPDPPEGAPVPIDPAAEFVFGAD